MQNKLNNILLSLCIISMQTFFATPTRVYVRNCTPLRFEVTIDYEPSTGTPRMLNLDQPHSIMPYDISDPKSIVLEINRLLPEGEHCYTIKLTNGSEALYLKQKFICTNTPEGSDLGISLASTCIQDPWYMNSQAKEKHEHLLFLNGHTIVVIYYAYDTINNEDVEYSFYEKLPVSSEIKKHATLCGKTLAYRLALPTGSNRQKLKTTSTSLLTLPAFSFNNVPLALISAQINRQANQNTSVENEAYITQEENIQPAEYLSPDEKIKALAYFSNEPGSTLFDSLYGQPLINSSMHNESWFSGLPSEETSKIPYKIPRGQTIAAISNY